MSNYDWSNYSEYEYFDNYNKIILNIKIKKLLNFDLVMEFIILFSKIFKEILAIEPEYNLFDKLNNKIKINKLNIKTINKSVEKFNSDSKFDFIICMNSF
jgi:hypothetical protein